MPSLATRVPALPDELAQLIEAMLARPRRAPDARRRARRAQAPARLEDPDDDGRGSADAAHDLRGAGAPELEPAAAATGARVALRADDGAAPADSAALGERADRSAAAAADLSVSADARRRNRLRTQIGAVVRRRSTRRVPSQQPIRFPSAAGLRPPQPTAVDAPIARGWLVIVVAAVIAIGAGALAIALAVELRFATWTRASFHATWPPRSAKPSGITAFAVWPFCMCLCHRPFGNRHTPGCRSDVIFAVQRDLAARVPHADRVAGLDAAGGGVGGRHLELAGRGAQLAERRADLRRERGRDQRERELVGARIGLVARRGRRPRDRAGPGTRWILRSGCDGNTSTNAIGCSPTDGVAMPCASSCARSSAPAGCDAKIAAASSSSVIGSPGFARSMRSSSAPKTWLFERASPGGVATGRLS